MIQEMKVDEVPFFRPEISDEEIAEVVDTLKSGWLTTGPKVRKFEAAFCEYTGAKHAVALNSCTAALHLGLEALGLKAGDCVVVPTMTFAATAEVVRYFGATPVFVDCDDTLCLSPEKLEETLRQIHEEKPASGLNPPWGKIKAIIPVHYGGYACDMKAIQEIADQYNIPVIEDAAHTVSSYYRETSDKDWTHTGRFSKIGCFSFYANKCITTGEGGMAVTDDEDLAKRMRLMSLHGMNNDAWKRFSDQGPWYYEIVAPGYKYNMTDIAAALGIHQLANADKFRDRRAEIAAKYNAQFKEIDQIELIEHDNNTRINSWHLYVIKLNPETLKINRAEFITEMYNRGLGASVHWQPLHLNPYYRDKYNFESGLFENAEKAWERIVSPPLFHHIRDEESEKVISTITDICRQFSR